MAIPQTISTDVLETGITSQHITLLESWGDFLARGDNEHARMTTSQIRKFFGEIKRIQADFENCKQDVILLDPKIAYSVGRARKEAKKDQKLAIEKFYTTINPLIRKIDGNAKKFKHFVQVCEAIVAYHKAKGGE